MTDEADESTYISNFWSKKCRAIRKKNGQIDFKKEHKAILAELKRLGLRK